MDTDSFLNPLSPELYELGDWYLSSSSSPPRPPPSMDTPAQYDIDAQGAARMNHPFLNNSLAAADHCNVSSHAQNAPYRSVFMLSDVASALLRQGFSPSKHGRPINASWMQNCSRQPCSVSCFPPRASLGLSKPTGILKRSPAEANLGDNHPENRVTMIKPFTILPPAASPLPPLPHKKRPSKRVKISSLDPSSTVPIKDTEPFNRERMSQRQIHIYAETQRRKRMKESLSILQSLVPKLKLKHVDRITILAEVIKHIHSLHVTLEELERKRLDIISLLGISEEDAMGLSPYWYVGIGSYNKGNYGDLDLQVKVTVQTSGPEVFITFHAPKCKGVWSGVLMLLLKYNVEVVNCTLATGGDNSFPSTFHCIHGKADNISSIESMDLQDKLERVILKQLSKLHKKI